jgi:hypothetical protein
MVRNTSEYQISPAEACHDEKGSAVATPGCTGLSPQASNAPIVIRLESRAVKDERMV